MHKLEVILRHVELNVDNAGFHPWSLTESEYQAVQINYENMSALGKVNVYVNVNDNELPELFDATSIIGVRWTYDF